MSYYNGLTRFWIPDYTVWTDTGVVAPTQQAGLLRVANKLYLYGGYPSSGAAVGTIYSATYDASGTVPVFTSTGLSLPSASGGGRMAIVGSTCYMFGDMGGSNAQGIWSAPLATPAVWSATGAVTGETRLNAKLVVNNGQIMIIKGLVIGSGVATIRYTSTSTPTSGWANSPATFGSPNSECGAITVGGNLIILGGASAPQQVIRIPFSANLSSSSAQYVLGNYLPGNIIGCPEMFHNGRDIFLVGGNYNSNDNWVYSCQPGNELYAWRYDGQLLPQPDAYLFNSSWIGGDGRACYISDASPRQGHIIQSDRVAVYVPSSAVENRISPYQGMPGTFADGSPAFVSSHVLMGMCPWLTDRTAAF